MNAGLLVKLFGREQRWMGACTIILNADANIQQQGTDSIVGGGAKSYAPRMVSGRILADAVCLLQDASALIIIQQSKHRAPTGEEKVLQMMTIADTAAVVAIEFSDTAALPGLGLSSPPIRTTGSHHGTSRP
ncbi:MAG: hypothetical protein AB7K24_06225 [Gemmataceae bacterium]